MCWEQQERAWDALKMFLCHQHLLKSLLINPSISQKCSQTLFTKLLNVHKDSILPWEFPSLHACDGGSLWKRRPQYDQKPLTGLESGHPMPLWFWGGGSLRIFPFFLSFSTMRARFPTGTESQLRCWRRQSVPKNTGSHFPPPGPWLLPTLLEVSSALPFPTKQLNLQLWKESRSSRHRFQLSESCPNSWSRFRSECLQRWLSRPFCLAAGSFSVSVCVETSVCVQFAWVDDKQGECCFQTHLVDLLVPLLAIDPFVTSVLHVLDGSKKLKAGDSPALVVIRFPYSLLAAWTPAPGTQEMSLSFTWNNYWFHLLSIWDHLSFATNTIPDNESWAMNTGKHDVNRFIRIFLFHF